MNNAEIRDVAERVLHAELGKFGFERAEVHSGVDQDGDPAIFIDAILAPGTPPLPGNVVGDAHFALGQALLAKGEARFPYLYTKRPGDELPEGEVPWKN